MDLKKISICGVNIDNVTMDDSIDIVRNFLVGDKGKRIYTPNTEIVMESKDDDELKNTLNQGDLIIPDGIGLIYGSKIRKKPLKERVTGFDLSIEMLKIANEKGYSVYLLGCKEGVARDAAENIKKDYPNLRIAGYHNGYFKGSHMGIKDSEEEREIINDINNSKTDILFVGLGFPKQESWINEHIDDLDIKVAIGNGGTMDILSGNAKRAPEIYQKLGLEWLYRLVKEPSRIKRQILLPKFILHVLFNKESVQ